MKTRIFSFILACIMMISLCACAEGAGNKPETTEKETSVQTTDALTGADATTDDERTDADTTELEPELQLNPDFFSDIGQTYSQIAERRGDRVGTGGVQACSGYYFENGYGLYLWSNEDIAYSDGMREFPYDENGNIILESTPFPKEDAKCYGIFRAQAKDLFINASYPINVFDVADIDGVENFDTGEDGIVTTMNYCLSFTYNEIYISVYYNDKDRIDTDSLVTTEGYVGYWG